MNIKIFKSLIVFVILLAVLNCSTRVKVHKVLDLNKDVHGIRYSLPKPFLMVKPNPNGDGTFTVEVVYMPDENQTYAINSKTYIAKHKLVVTLKEGLLKKIDWTGEGEKIVPDLGNAVSQIAKSEIERLKRKEDERKAEADAEKQKKALEIGEIKEKINQLEEIIKTKKLNLIFAKAEVKSLKDFDMANATEEEKILKREQLRLAKLKVYTLDIEIKEAVKELKEEKKRLEDAQAGYSELVSISPYNEPKNNEPEKTAWGPVLYAINDFIENKKEKVTLTAVNWDSTGIKQKEFVTSAPPEPAIPPIAIPKLTTKGPIVLDYKNNRAEFKVSFDQKVNKINDDQTMLTRIEEGEKEPTLIPTKDLIFIRLDQPTDLTITVTRRLAAGKYKLSFEYEYGDGNPPPENTVSIDLAVTR